ncbi:hypothetical protein [Persicobacter diffluens]
MSIGQGIFHKLTDGLFFITQNLLPLAILLLWSQRKREAFDYAFGKKIAFRYIYCFNFIAITYNALNSFFFSSDQIYQSGSYPEDHFLEIFLLVILPKFLLALACIHFIFKSITHNKRKSPSINETATPSEADKKLSDEQGPVFIQGVLILIFMGLAIRYFGFLGLEYIPFFHIAEEAIQYFLSFYCFVIVPMETISQQKCVTIQTCIKLFRRHFILMIVVINGYTLFEYFYLGISSMDYPAILFAETVIEIILCFPLFWMAQKLADHFQIKTLHYRNQ